jgi:hypothetical protein
LATEANWLLNNGNETATYPDRDKKQAKPAKSKSKKDVSDDGGDAWQQGWHKYSHVPLVSASTTYSTCEGDQFVRVAFKLLNNLRTFVLKHLQGCFKFLNVILSN